MEAHEIALKLLEKYKAARSQSARIVIMSMAQAKLERPMYIDWLELCLDHLAAMAQRCEVCD